MGRDFTLRLYVSEEFPKKWKEFIKICKREGEGASQKLQSWICDYVNKHGHGNPQTLLFKPKPQQENPFGCGNFKAYSVDGFKVRCRLSYDLVELGFCQYHCVKRGRAK